MKPHDCSQHGYCKDTRPNGEYRVRRYRCEICGARWSTIEFEFSFTQGGGSTKRPNAIIALSRITEKKFWAIVEFFDLLPGKEQ